MTANAVGTNGLACLPKQGGVRDIKFLVTHPMTDQCCLTSAIARRSALAAGPSSYLDSNGTEEVVNVGGARGLRRRMRTAPRGGGREAHGEVRQARGRAHRAHHARDLLRCLLPRKHPISLTFFLKFDHNTDTYMTPWGQGWLKTSASSSNLICRPMWRSGGNTRLLLQRLRVRFPHSVHGHVCLYWVWWFLCIICMYVFPKKKYKYVFIRYLESITQAL
jgi:hypothetical protein